MIKKIRNLLRRSVKITNAVNTVGLALLAGLAAVELAFRRSKVVFGKFKIIAMRNKIASAIISLILFTGIVIGGMTFASGNDDYPIMEEKGVDIYDSVYLEIPINVMRSDPIVEYPPHTPYEEVADAGLSNYEEEDEIIEEIIDTPPIIEEPEPDEEDDDDDEPDDDDGDDDDDSDDGGDGDDNNQEDDTVPPPPPPRQCIWVRVYTQQTFDRGSHQERTIIAGQQELWIMKDGWAIGQRFYSLDEANDFLTSEENLSATNPSTGFSVQFENIYETVTVWVPNIVTENVFSHERCNDCGAVREN